jgi:hypothetical protein
MDDAMAKLSGGIPPLLANVSYFMTHSQMVSNNLIPIWKHRQKYFLGKWDHQQK